MFCIAILGPTGWENRFQDKIHGYEVTLISNVCKDLRWELAPRQ